MSTMQEVYCGGTGRMFVFEATLILCDRRGELRNLMARIWPFMQGISCERS